MQDHTETTAHPDYGSKIETAVRIGLKGGAHLLGDEENQINITSLSFDGHEHLGRKISKDRVINRMRGLRSYFSFDPNITIDDRSSKHNKQGSQTYEDCQLLQLTDLLVGSFRTILGKQTKNIHYELAHPLNQIIDRYHKGYKRMQNSRWFKGFCMSQCKIENGNWMFSEILPTQQDSGLVQGTLL